MVRRDHNSRRRLCGRIINISSKLRRRMLICSSRLHGGMRSKLRRRIIVVGSKPRRRIITVGSKLR